MGFRQKIEKSYFDKEYSTRATLQRLSGYAVQQKKPLLVMFFLLIANASVAITLPFLVRDAFNELEGQTPKQMEY